MIFATICHEGDLNSGGHYYANIKGGFYQKKNGKNGKNE